MKDVNAHCFLRYTLVQQIQRVGYEIISKTYTQYGDCTIFCKPYTRDMKVCIKASYVDADYWNVNTGKLEHMTGCSFYAQLGTDGLWRSMTGREELFEYLKEVSKYK